MSDKKKQKVKDNKSRRGFLKGAAVAAGAAGLVGFPGVMRVSAQAPIKMKMQTAWDAGTVGLHRVPEVLQVCGGDLGGQADGRGVPGRGHRGDLRDVRRRQGGGLRRHHSFDAYWPGKVPVCSLPDLLPLQSRPARSVRDLVREPGRQGDRPGGLRRPQHVLPRAHPARRQPDPLQGAHPFLRGFQGQEDPLPGRHHRGHLQGRRASPRCFCPAARCIRPWRKA